eukprot:3949858-Pyramimonas_sp.AAC.1
MALQRADIASTYLRGPELDRPTLLRSPPNGLEGASGGGALIARAPVCGAAMPDETRGILSAS